MLKLVLAPALDLPLESVRHIRDNGARLLDMIGEIVDQPGSERPVGNEARGSARSPSPAR